MNTHDAAKNENQAKIFFASPSPSPSATLQVARANGVNTQ